MDHKFQNESNHCLNSPITETLEPIPEASEIITSDHLPFVFSLEGASVNHEDEKDSILVSNIEVKTSELSSVSSKSNLSITSKETTFFEPRSTSSSSHIRSNRENVTSPLMTKEALCEYLEKQSTISSLSAQEIR